MAEEGLSRQRILDTAETVMRKYGPAKTNMSDVAKALGVSHPALYRHYENKSALWEAVAERWIEGSLPLLQQVAEENSPPEAKLYSWLLTLHRFKRDRSQSDPELFAMYASLVSETEGVWEKHVAKLLRQLSGILEEGMDQGSFVREEPKEAALAVFLATTRFHHAQFVKEWQKPDAGERFEIVFRLIRRSLAARTAPDKAKGGRRQV